jgi:hypothetical protein
MLGLEPATSPWPQRRKHACPCSLGPLSCRVCRADWVYAAPGGGRAWQGQPGCGGHGLRLGTLGGTPPTDGRRHRHSRKHAKTHTVTSVRDPSEACLAPTTCSRLGHFPLGLHVFFLYAVEAAAAQEGPGHNGGRGLRG